MDVTLKDVIKAAKELPESSYKEVHDLMQKLIKEEKSRRDSAPVKCIHCGSKLVVRNGKRHNKQAYICRSCGKTFVQTSKSSIQNSRQSQSVWKQVIQDTVTGVSIDNTAKELDLHHETVFYMRHKILHCLETICNRENIKLDGVFETDETYVLENNKGTKFDFNYHREPRRHGAIATKPGISDEYICICTSIGDDKKCVAESVNRANPSKEELNEVFGEKVKSDTVLICDGNRNYDVLEDRCTVAHSNRINNVNGFHGFIKDRMRKARGVATKYLNRYNKLFAHAYGKTSEAPDKIFELMTTRNDSYATSLAIKKEGLLEL